MERVASAPRPDSMDRLARIEARLESMTAQIAYLVEHQRKTDELFAEATPILREVMATATTKLDGLEKQGYFAFGRELVRVGERIVEGFSPADVQKLGDAVVGILEAVRAMTQPELLEIATEASASLRKVDEVEPIGLIGMVRATRDDDVQRGMAVMMDVMRHVGRGAEAIAAHRAARPAATKRAKLDAITGAKKRKVLGTERTPPTGAPAAQGARPPARRSATDVREPATTVIGGVELTPDGHLADPMAWTPDLAGQLAAALGVELAEPQVRVVRFAREDFLATGMAPNIRRITLGLGVTTRDIYALFPKAPARTIAKIAGIPKPVGCL